VPRFFFAPFGCLAKRKIQEVEIASFELQSEAGGHLIVPNTTSANAASASP